MGKDIRKQGIVSASVNWHNFWKGQIKYDTTTSLLEINPIAISTFVNCYKWKGIHCSIISNSKSIGNNLNVYQKRTG